MRSKTPDHPSSASIFLICFASGVLFIILQVSLIIFYIDPFQFFRVASGTPYFSQSMQRNQHAGIIRNYPFDSIIIGNSAGAMFEPSMFDAYSPKIEVQNLIFNGGTVNENVILLKSVLQYKELKVVFWNVNGQQFEGYRWPTFPNCMYQQAWKYFPYCYLLNVDVLREAVALKSIYLKPFSEGAWVKHIDRFQQYVPMPLDRAELSCQLQTKLARGRTNNILSFDDDSALDQRSVRDFESLIASVVRDNPKVKFVFYFPPLYVPFFWQSVGKTEMQFRLYIKRRLLQFANVELYEFQAMTDVTHDVTKYRDSAHYYREVAQEMANDFASGRYRVTESRLRSGWDALVGELEVGHAIAQSEFKDLCH